MRANLRAGIAIYNEGHFHAAHDAWEEHWLDLESGTTNERLLHGLIQFTAAIHHASNRNWSGATGLAESAREYLSRVEPADVGVNVDTVVSYLIELGRDPEYIERRRPPDLQHDGVAITFADLDLAATGVVAAVLAEADGYDEEMIASANEYAIGDEAANAVSSPFVTLLFDFVRQPADRPIVHERLSAHVDRRRGKETDVSGLFEED